MNTNNISPEVFDLYSKFLGRNVEMSGADKNLLTQILKTVQSSTIKQLQINENLRSELSILYKSLAKSSKKGIQETDPRKIVFKDIDLNNKNFLDYGSNKFDTIMKLNNWGAKANFYACDVVEKNIIDERLVGKIDYRVIKEDSILPYEDQFFDVINVQYVLHHIASDESINKLLKEFYRILKPSGQIILWEETFYNAAKNNLPGLVEFNRYMGISSDLELTKEFYELEDEKKFEFILLNDVMINLNNPHMQWDVNYKPFDYDKDNIQEIPDSNPGSRGWVEIFESNNFKLSNLFNFGLRASGSIKQGANMILYFDKLS